MDFLLLVFRRGTCRRGRYYRGGQPQVATLLVIPGRDVSLGPSSRFFLLSSGHSHQLLSSPSIPSYRPSLLESVVLVSPFTAWKHLLQPKHRREARAASSQSKLPQRILHRPTSPPGVTSSSEAVLAYHRLSSITLSTLTNRHQPLESSSCVVTCLATEITSSHAAGVAATPALPADTPTPPTADATAHTRRPDLCPTARPSMTATTRPSTSEACPLTRSPCP